MTPEQLKASILQYAIQGKLVEQRPEEGTGEELYRQIQEEKQRLIKAGKIKKEKSLPKIAEDEIPFDIPESWKWVRLPEIGTSSLGKALNKGLDIGNEVPYLCSINVYWDGINLNQIKKAKFSAIDMKKYLLRRGDLLICEGGDVGRSAVWDRDIEMYYQNALHCVRFFGAINPYYFKHCLELYKYNRILESASKGMTIKHLVQGALYSIPFPLPPLAEQKRIVAKIEELLPYVDRYATAYEKLEQFNAKFPKDMKKSVLQYAIQGKLVEQRPEEGTGKELYRQIQEEKKRLIKAGKIKKEKPLPEIVEDEIPFDIPESWKWVRLLDVVEEKPANGFSPKGVDYQTAVKNLTLTATTSGYFKADAFKYVDIQLEPGSKYWLKKDDLLIQRSNSRELVGTSCIYTGDDDAFIYPDLMMKLRVMNGVDVKYVDHVLKSPLTRNYFSKTASGTSESMPKINQGIVSATLIPLPPLAEQKRIVAKLEEILPLCERLK